MYNSEFEKQVQEKMEGLKMTPSDNMWGRIENDLPGKPRRKKLVLLLLLLLGGCGLVWMLSRVNNSQAVSLAASEKTQKADSVHESKDGGVVLQQHDKKDSTGKLSNAQKADTSKLYPYSEQKPVLTATDAEKTGQENNIGNESNTVKQINKKPIPGSQRVIKSTATGITDANDEPAGSKTQPGYLVSKKARTKITVMQQPMNDEISMSSDGEILSPSEPFTASLIYSQPAAMNKNLLPRTWPAEPIVASASFAKPVNKKGRGKWEFGITLSGGLSKQVSNPLYIKTNDGQVAFFGIGGPPPTADSSGNAQANAKSSKAFTAGFYMRKPVNKRWSIQAGLTYSYLSYTSRVGQQVDSAAGYFVNGNQLFSDNYFRPVSFFSNMQPSFAQDYVNRVHLLQVPFEAHYNLGKKRQWSVLGGFSAGYLLGSNALVYNSSPQQYLSSKEAFNKLIFSLHTGISFTNSRGYPFSAGIRFSYGVNSFIRKSINDQHLVSSLLFLNIPFKK